MSAVLYWQADQLYQSESEQNTTRTESHWPAARILLNRWLRLGRETGNVEQTAINVSERFRGGAVLRLRHQTLTRTRQRARW